MRWLLSVVLVLAAALLRVDFPGSSGPAGGPPGSDPEADGGGEAADPDGAPAPVLSGRDASEDLFVTLRESDR